MSHAILPASLHPLSQHNMQHCPWCTEGLFVGRSSAAMPMEQPSVVSNSPGRNFSKNPYKTIGMVFVYRYCKGCLSLVCACVCVCTDLQNDFREQAVRSGSIGWSLTVVPQARMQLHTVPEAENLFPVVSRTVAYASKKQWRSYRFLQLVLLLVILSNNKDVKVKACASFSWDVCNSSNDWLQAVMNK